jgi:hypothetical protein
MAVTIEVDLLDMMTAYNPMDLVTSSTNSSETSFKYMAKLVVDGTTVHNYLIPADPVNANGYLDISNIVESYLSFDFDTTLAEEDIVSNTGSIVETYVVFGEQYDVSGTITDFTGLATSNVIQAINGSLNYEDFIGFDYTEYLNNSTALTKFLTNAPISRSVNSEMNAWLYSYNDASSVYPNLFYIKTYDSNGTQNGAFQITNPYRPPSAVTDNHIRIAVGANLNDITGVVTVSGAEPILDDDVATYTVQMIDTGITATSELRTFTRVVECTGLDRFTIYFLNELGGFDSFVFDLVSHVDWSKETSQYKAQAFERGANTITRNLTRHQRRSYNTTTHKSISLTSNWITETESVWLRELFDSPVIYIEYPDGTLVYTLNILMEL